MSTYPLPQSFGRPASPVAPVPPPVSPFMAPPYTLYPVQAVGLATFLGSPIAGTIIMALNYRRLGRSGSAITAIALGTVTMAALLGIGFILPEHSPSYVISIIPLFIIVRIAKSLQGDAVERHKLAGGKIASLWKATGIGLLAMVVLIGMIVAGVLLASPSTHTLKVGQSEVIYSGKATEADAQALGNALTADGYFNPTRATSVILKKDAAGTTLELVVNEKFAQREDALPLAMKVAAEVAPTIGGTPLTLKLVNPELKELKSTQVE